MYFTMQMTERNGEQEYVYDFLIQANSIEEAFTKADNHVKTWYTDPNVSYNVQYDWYEFFGGSIIIKYTGPDKTTKKAFINMLSNQYTIK